METAAFPNTDTSVRTVHYARAVRILVANAKGGSGKTIVATNLASQFAQQGFNTSLLDCDPQESSIHWLQSRQDHLPPITGVAVARDRQGGFSNLRWRLRVPMATDRAIIDTPAGLTGPDLATYVDYSDIIVVPVVPSSIDMHAAAKYIENITCSTSFQKHPKPIALIANRVRSNTILSGKLFHFLDGLNIPNIASLRDTQFYLRACELGYGLVDFSRRPQRDIDDWHPLMAWLEEQIDGLDTGKLPQNSCHAASQ